VKFDQGIVFEQHVFTTLPYPLYELDNAASEAVPEAARQHAKGRGTFALAITGEHHHQPLVDGGRSDAVINMGFLALHRLLVALVSCAGFSHEVVPMRPVKLEKKIEREQ
jgi:hypothetical protein